MTHYGPPDDLYDDQAESTTDELVDLLRLVRSTRKEWQALEAILEADLGLAAGVGQHDGYIVRTSAEKTEWDHDAVRRKVVLLAVGDAPPPTWTKAQEIADAIWSCVPGSPQWRVGGLKALGIDPTDYRTRLPGRRTVEILPRSPVDSDE